MHSSLRSCEKRLLPALRATSVPDTPERRPSVFFLTDRDSGLRFLVHTGAEATVQGNPSKHPPLSPTLLGPTGAERFARILHELPELRQPPAGSVVKHEVRHYIGTSGPPALVERLGISTPYGAKVNTGRLATMRGLQGAEPGYYTRQVPGTAHTLHHGETSQCRYLFEDRPGTNPVAPKDVPNTAIATPFGLFEFLRMPFGLRNAGQTFQWFMDGTIRGLRFCHAYLGDLLVASSTLEEHENHLRIVSQRLVEHGVVVNMAKCELGVRQLSFLGHVISASGVLPQPNKVEAIQGFPQPMVTVYAT
ncbi:uncharacterized protein LOC119378511 [Rhipicephalus sanguineus]|uniref:uncharacterized protein LOC119378511 n=1 Tax=Rhipicephalus sanguineus TaxID=34632 RepID=UPI001892DEB7|nr:uncharacterized protein LOC119378511 [Rhipicephalus sanguineus]